MRGLTLWQPMAWAIVEGHKPVENRSWPLPKSLIGQRFALHAGKKYDTKWAKMIHEEFALEVPRKADIDLGAIVAVATFAGCITKEDAELWDEEDAANYQMDPRTVHGIYGWFSGPYGFLLRDVMPLPRPIPFSGWQGLWTVPEEIEAQISKQLSGGGRIVVPPAPPLPQPRRRPRRTDPNQLTLVDPVAFERERILKILRDQAHRWRSNATPASNLVATAFDHVIKDIEG